MEKFEKILDCFWPTVLVMLSPLMIYGFMGMAEANRKNKETPTHDEMLAAAHRKVMMEAEARIKEQQTVKEKGIIPPPQLYNPDDKDFNIPLEQLLEGNHGRYL